MTVKLVKSEVNVVDWVANLTVGLIGWDSAAQVFKYRESGGTVRTLATTDQTSGITLVKASEAEAQGATADDRYMTPAKVKAYVDYIIASQVEAEAMSAAGKLITAERLGQGFTAKKASAAEAKTGTVTDKWLAPATGKDVVQAKEWIVTSPKSKTTTQNENVAGLASSLVLCNGLAASIETHAADNGTSFQTAVMAQFNDIKSRLNNHYNDYGDTTFDEAKALYLVYLNEYNDHLADAGAAGEEHKVTSDPVDAESITTWAHLYTALDNLCDSVTAHFADAALGVPVIHQATGTTYTLTYGSPTNCAAVIACFDELDTKLTGHFADAVAHTAGDNTLTGGTATPGEEHWAHPSLITEADATDLTTTTALSTAIRASYVSHDDDAELGTPTQWHYATEGADHTLAAAPGAVNWHTLATEAADMKTKINGHIEDSTCHPAGDDDPIDAADAVYVEEHINVHTFVKPADATDVTTLLANAGTLLTWYAAHNTDAALASAWAYHKGQSNNALVTALTPTTIGSAVTRLNDLKAKLNLHMASAVSHPYGDDPANANPNAAFGTTDTWVDTDVAAGDYIMPVLLDSGTGAVKLVSLTAGAGTVTGVFSADPQNDAKLQYLIIKPKVTS